MKYIKKNKSFTKKFLDFFKTDNTCPVCGTEMVDNQLGLIVGSEESVDRCPKCGYNISFTWDEIEQKRKEYNDE